MIERLSMKLNKRVPLENILVPDSRLLAPHHERVESLAESVRDVGLLSPIIIRPHEKLPGKYWLVAGLTRMRAWEKRGRTTIPAFIQAVDATTARLMEIDENLKRAMPTESERVLLVAERRKLIDGGLPKADPAKSKTSSKTRGHRGRNGNAALALANGVSLRTVRRSCARAVALGEETIARIGHTSLDSGPEMDALITLTHYASEQASALIERAAAGEAVSAVAIVQNLKGAPPPTVNELIAAWRNKMTRLWDRADSKTRTEFTFWLKQATTGETADGGDPHHLSSA